MLTLIVVSKYKNVCMMLLADRIRKTGGYYVPDFVVLQGPVWFAIHNIDCIDDTSFDQDTTHATVIVMWKRDDETAE